MDARGRHKAHDLKFAILRYFNVAGADPNGRLGQSTPQATHLIRHSPDDRGLDPQIGSICPFWQG
jgi:hypothetical protein